MNEKEVIERLNRFKTIKVLYGNTFSMHLEQLEQLQNDIETVLNLLEKKDKIIDLMAKELVKAHEWFYSEFDNYTKEDFIKYFENKQRRNSSMEENMIRGAILAMQVDNNTKTKLFKYLTNLEELKTEHKIMKRILVKNNLWETLLNDDEFIEHLEED